MLHGLAVLAASEQRPNDALQYFESAIASSPQRASALYDYGCFLLGLNRDQEALTMFGRLVAIVPSDPRGWYHQAFLRHAVQDSVGAEQSLQRCLALAPAYPKAVALAARMLREAGDYATAFALFESASKRSDATPELFHCWWQFCSMSAFPEKSAVVVSKAIQRYPQDAELNIDSAAVAEEGGLRNAAVRSYRAALALDPNRGLALGNLLGLLGDGAEPDLVARAASLMRDSRVRAPARAVIGYGLAKVYHQRRCIDDAFEVVKSANEARREETGPLDRQKTLHLNQRVLSTDKYLESIQVSPSEDKDIVPTLIVGMPRTGTTLLEQIIATDAGVIALGELPDLPIVADRVPASSWDLDGVVVDSEAVVSALVRAHDQYQSVLKYRIGGVARGRTIVIDKFPLNVWNVGLFLKCFPEGKVLWCRRSIEDVCLSIYFENFAHSQRYATDLGDLVFYYRQVEALMVEWMVRHPSRIFSCVYEDMVDHPGVVIRQMTDFLGLAWSPGFLAHHHSSRPVQTPSRWQVRESINRKGVGKWSAYSKWLRPYCA